MTRNHFYEKKGPYPLNEIVKTIACDNTFLNKNNIVIHGPQIEILDEAIEMEKNNISITVQDSKQLLDVIKIIHNPQELNKRKELTKNYIFSKSNSTDKILNELFN